MIQSVADEEAYATLGEATKNVVKIIRKESETQKSNLTISMYICSALDKSCYYKR
jgi:hypothetical protein